MGAGRCSNLAPYYLTALVGLLGPRSRRSRASRCTPTPLRTIGVGPHAGEVFAAEVPTHAAALLQLAGGALATLTVSFEAAGQYLSGLEIYGSEATMRLPDANAFGGTVSLRRGGGSEPETVSYPPPDRQETRGLGLHDLVESIGAGRPHKASDTHALHVLEAALAIGRSAAERRVTSTSRCRAPDPRRGRAHPERSRHRHDARTATEPHLVLALGSCSAVDP